MCVPGLDPVTLGMLALSAGGAAVNGYESNKTRNEAISARNAATQAELRRQQVYQRQAQNAFDTTKANFTPETQSKNLADQKVQTADKFIAAAPTAEQVGSVGSTGAPRVVQEAADKKVADIFSRAGGLNSALGNLKGWDANAFNNDLALNSGARDLGRITDFSRTSAGVNGLEQSAAYNNALHPNSGIGDIMQFVGNVGAYGSGKGWFNPLTKQTTTAFNPNALSSLY